MTSSEIDCGLTSESSRRAALLSIERTDDHLVLGLDGSLGAVEASRNEVVAFLNCAGVAPRVQNRVEVVLEEVVANIVRHGIDGQPGHHVHVEVRLEDGSVCLVIEDDAPAYNPLARPEIDLPDTLDEAQVGGLGVHLVRKMAASVTYEEVPRGDKRSPLLNATRPGNRLTVRVGDTTRT